MKCAKELPVQQILMVLNGLLFGEMPEDAAPRLAADGTLNMPPDGYGLGLQVSHAQ